MTASLFGVTTLLVTLADSGDAPALFSKKLKKFKELPVHSLGLATIGLIASIVTAVLPENVRVLYDSRRIFNPLFNWAFIILSALRILERNKSY